MRLRLLQGHVPMLCLLDLQRPAEADLRAAVRSTSLCSMMALASSSAAPAALPAPAPALQHRLSHALRPRCAAGMYDGTLGVVGAIEALRALRKAVGGCTCAAAPPAMSRPAPACCCTTAHLYGTASSCTTRACILHHHHRHSTTTTRACILHHDMAPCGLALQPAHPPHLLLPPPQHTQGYQPRRPLEVMMFTSEEPTRFGLSCSGSRAMAHTMTVDYLSSKLDENGTDWLTVTVVAAVAAVLLLLLTLLAADPCCT